MNEESSSGENMEAAAPEKEEVVNEAVQEEKTVPLSAFEAERVKRQQTQDELSVIKEHLNLLQAKQSQNQKEEDSFSDDDVMTYGEFKKLAGKIENDFKVKMTELETARKYPDYEEVIKKYLPEEIKKRPKLGQYLQNTQDFEYAYEIAKSSESYRKDHYKSKKNKDAEQIIENLERTGSLSEAGGTTPISMAKRYKDMSDEDFRKEVAKNMGYI